MGRSPNVLKISLYYFLLTTGSFLVPLSISRLFDVSYLELAPTGFGPLVFGVILLVLLFAIQNRFLEEDSRFANLTLLGKAIKVKRTLVDFFVIQYFIFSYSLLFVAFVFWFVSVNSVSPTGPTLLLYFMLPMFFVIIFNNVDKFIRWLLILTPLIWTLVFLCLIR
jgi:hypothetical protein